MTYIDMDQQNLQADIARLILGEAVEVDIDSFQNDVETFTCKVKMESICGGSHPADQG